MSESSDNPVIRLRGVRHNNLKNFDLDLPLGRLIVISGLSGSGKSSLAFDTLFAEGQRRYIETFSPYARQFFDRMDKPQVDSIEGIPPAIAVEQRNAVRTTRSTVGTMTEICHYLKLLWPHFAQLNCRQCGQPVRKDSPQQIWQTLLDGECGMRHAECLITFDLPLSEKLSIENTLALIAKQGYQRLLVNGETLRVDEALGHCAFRTPPAALTIAQDRVKLVQANRARFIEACEQAYHFGKGKLTVWRIDPPSSILQPRAFSNRRHCATCDLEYREPSPALFSFNHPIGACPACRGFGRIITIDYDLVLPDRSRTLAQGVVKPWLSGQSAECQDDLMKFCRLRKAPADVPFHDLPKRWQDWVIDGDPGYGKDRAHEWPRAWYGVKGYFRWLESKAYKMHVRVLLSRYRAYSTCPACLGQRFQPEALLYRIRLDDFDMPPSADDESRVTSHGSHFTASASLSLADFYALPTAAALRVVETLVARLRSKPSDPLGLALGEVRARLGYLVEVGLGYLALDRPTRSLSGGETERVNLTTCLGTRLVNTLYVLDEPSVGLHPRDTARLVRILQHLRDLGNTVVVVEHEPGVIRAADQVVELGPGSGEAGGAVVFQGPVAELVRSRDSLTGQYLSGAKRIEIPQRRPVDLMVSRRLDASGVPPSGGFFGPEPLIETSRVNAELQTAGFHPQPEALHDTLPTTTCRVQPHTTTLKISGASRHNLKQLTVEIPLNRFVCVTGVSGSGKTTLVRDVLLPTLDAKLKAPRSTVKSRTDENDPEDSALRIPHSALVTGWESLARVVLVDQSALGKTPRSNPAVYIGAFDALRELFAQTDLAQQRGLSASAFSFNSSQGQCERCRGAGFEKIEMQFLSDVFIRCPDCNGRRYRPHILEVRVSRPSSVVSRPDASPIRATDYGPRTTDSREWSIADLLAATVDDAIRFLEDFSNSHPAQRAMEKLKLLQEVGLGYLRLGQPVNTLSGGESQRLKLVGYLSEFGVPASTGPTPGSPRPPAASRARPPEGGTPNRTPDRTLFLFDEPTTGLHFDDIRVLLRVFQRLVDAGHAVLVVEHNLDVIKCADWVIDLGPEAGDEGGRIVAQGTPEAIADCPESHTGRFLRDAGFAANRSVVAPRRARDDAALPPGGRASASGRADTDLGQTPRRAEDGAALPLGLIAIHGAREHNLKNLSVMIPRHQFVVITGVSGSGKSTLAFDLLFTEGQRRFLDSMNAYARQFVEQLPRPEVDLIAGIPPTVSIEQRSSRGGGKSTVATVTEIHHFLRLLFARLGTQYCPECQLPVEAQTRDQVGRHLETEMKRRGDLLLLAPVVKNRKGFHTDVAAWAARHGYREVRADGKIFSTRARLRLDRFREHNVEIVIGVLETKPKRGLRGAARSSDRKTAQQLIDEALQVGRGTLLALDNHGHLSVHSTERACPGCGRSFEPLDPKNFSYNSVQGWCPRCRGFGELFYLPDVERGANADSIEESWFGWQEGNRELCPDCQGARLNPLARAVHLFGVPPSGGKRIPNPRRASKRDGGPPKGGTPNAPTIETIGNMTVERAERFFRGLKPKGRAAEIARDILPEIRERLKFLAQVGLHYLQLGRGVTTLSGGESQRIRLAAQLGSNLSGVLYILDEPTIGLHARDNEQLLAALAILKSRGNSLVVVEHDEATMRHADYIIDLGPGAGVRGGQVVAGGTLTHLLRHEDSITGQCLRAKKKFPTRGQRRRVLLKDGAASSGEHSAFAGWLTLRHAAVHNLNDLTVRFPLNRLVVVTGVSGSGKSTLLRDCLLPAMASALASKSRRGRAGVSDGGGNQSAGASEASPASRLCVHGFEPVRAVYEVDQSPIGRTPRSIPATYVGFFDEIRRLFAQIPEARMRGYSPSRFSFNSAQGRCPGCEGAGTIKLEMSFMPPAFVRCETCQGLRFNPETLDIKFNGRNVAEVLELSVAEALDFFAAFPRIHRPLLALHDTGLDYLKLGQPSPTLSGGEAQRVKLVTHLLAGLRQELPRFDPRGPHNLFVLEEPTIGLHSADVRRLADVLQRLVDGGHTVVVIEHNLELIAEADWIIDLGPEGGDGGGRLVAEGPPERIAQNKRSHTGRYLRSLLLDA